MCTDKFTLICDVVHIHHEMNATHMRKPLFASLADLDGISLVVLDQCVPPRFDHT